MLIQEKFSGSFNQQNRIRIVLNRKRSKVYYNVMMRVYMRYLVFFLIIIIPGRLLHPAESVKNIIVLNSYHEGFQWTDGITAAIKKSFIENENRIELYFEYLDRKRFTDNAYIKLIPGFLILKYQSRDINLIIVTDDDALNLVREYDLKLFPRVPVVYAGINDLTIPDVLNGTRYTGILEETPPDGTLKLATMLHPLRRHFYVLADYTSSGRVRVKSLKMISGNYPGITFEYSADTTVGEIKKKLSSLTEDTIVIHLAFFYDSSGRFFDYNDLISEILPVIPVPVYSITGVLQGHGVTGGVVNCSEYQGREAVRIANRILGGEKPENIPAKRDIALQTVIDYRELKKFGADTSLIPDGSLVINKPAGFYGFYHANMNLILSLLSVCFLAVIIILAAGRFKILKINRERMKVISELQSANDEVTTLQGLLPICSGCKNIRNDEGYWEQMESYISKHSAATFTHSLCPDCVKKYYPDYYLKNILPRNKNNRANG